MRIQVEKFLAATALLASAAVLGFGCSSENTDTNNRVSGGGAGGAKGGSGGKGGSDASTTGGTAGAAGSAAGGTAGTAAGGTAGSAQGGAAGGGGTSSCLGDTAVADAGSEPCAALPYYLTDCSGSFPLGADLCDYASVNLRPGVFEALLTCLATVTGDACSAQHNDAVNKCYADVSTNACQHDPLPSDDGGTYDPCADVAAGCPNLNEATCNVWLNPLTTAKEIDVLLCYNPTSENSCDQDFETCLGLPQ